VPLEGADTQPTTRPSFIGRSNKQAEQARQQDMGHTTGKVPQLTAAYACAMLALRAVAEPSPVDRAWEMEELKAWAVPPP